MNYSSTRLLNQSNTRKHASQHLTEFPVLALNFIFEKTYSTLKPIELSVVC